MTEAGDDFREYRDKRRAVRQAMISCWRCDAKHMPNEPCTMYLADPTKGARHE